MAKGAEKDAAVAGAGIGKKLGKAMLAGVAVVGGGAVLAGKALYGLGKTFDDLKVTIQQGTGASGKALDGLMDSAKNVGKKIPANFDDIGKALADLNTQTGASGKTLEGLTSGVLEASRALGENGADNAALFGQTLNQANIPAKDGRKLLDKLFVASQKYGTSLGGMMKNLKKFGPQMQSAGLSMDQTIDLFGQFNKAGVSANRIVPSLNAAMIKWSKAGKDPAKMLQNLAKKVANAKTQQEAMQAVSQDMSGPGAAAFVTAIRKSGVSLDDLGKSLKNSKGAVKDASGQTQAFSEKWKIFKNNVMVGLQPLASAVFDAIAKGMDYINKNGLPAIQALSKWINKNLVPGFEAIWTAIQQNVLPVVKTLVTFIGGKLVGGLKSTFTWIAKNKDAAKAIAIALGAVVAVWATYKAALATGRLVMKGVAAAQKAWTVATKAWSAATKIAMGVQKAFNLVMKMNTIGLIITGLTLLVAGLIAAYKKSDKFRAVVQAVWKAVKKYAKGALDFFTQTIWPGIKKFFGWMKSAFTGVRDFFKDAWSKIKGFFSGAWSWVSGFFKKHWKTILGILTGPIGLAVSQIWQHWDTIKKYFSKAWNWVKGAFKTSWNGLKKILTWPVDEGKKAISTAWGNIKTNFKNAWNWAKGTFKSWWNGLKAILKAPIDGAKSAIKTGWNNIKTNFRNAWNWVRGTFKSMWHGVEAILKAPISAVKGFLKAEVKGWKNIFRGAKSAIKSIWSGVKSAVKAPVAFVVNHVVRPFESGINKILGFVHLPKIPMVARMATGGVLPGYTPGRDVHQFYSPTGGMLELSGGEAIMRPEFTRAVGGKRGVDALNAKARRGEAFASGGVYGAQSFLAGGVWDKIKGAGSWLADHTVGAAKAIWDFISNPASWLRHLMGNVGNSWAGKVVGKIPGMIGSALGAMVKKAFGGGGDVGNYKPGAGVQQWAGVAKQAMAAAGLPLKYLNLLLYRMNVESGGNPNAVNNWDINAQNGVPSQGLMQVIPPTFAAYAGPYRSLGIRNPLANIYAAIKYSLARYGLSGLAAAWGGTGGYANGTASARPGWAWVGERGPELVRFRGRERIYSNAKSKGMAAPGNNVTLNVSNYNPVAEPSSVSLNRTLQKAAALGVLG